MSLEREWMICPDCPYMMIRGEHCWVCTKCGAVKPAESLLSIIDSLRAELLASRQDADRLAAWVANVAHPNSRCASGGGCFCGKSTVLAAHAALVAGPKPVRSACPDLAVEE